MHLPDEGAFYASRRGGQQYRGWNVDRYALVSLVNAQRAGNYILTMVNRDPKKSKPPVPDPFPTPDSQELKAKARNSNSFAKIAANMIAAQRRKQEHGA